MDRKNYDILIIGGGIAGIYCARYLAKAGKSVAIVEKGKPGGMALRWGALPVKRMLDFIKKNNGENSIENWDREIENLEKRISDKIRLENIDIYYGEGEFIDSGSFDMGNCILEGDYIVIASGTEATGTEEVPVDGKRIITHKEAISFGPIPKEIIILGGNVEGAEFAAIYGELGVNTTIIEKENQLLPGNDADLVYPVEEHFTQKGIKIIKGVGVNKASIKGEKVEILLENGEIIKGDKTLTTLTRRPGFPKGIEKLKIRIDYNRILVDDNLKTGEDRIFAIGDINGVSGMAHSAISQGIGAAEHILYGTPINRDYTSLPRAIFTLPEIAGAGKQEWELKGQPYKAYRYQFKDTWRGWSKGIEEGFVKVLADEKGAIRGIWMVGEEVSEYLGLLDMFIKKGLTVDDIKSNLFIHPSLTEALLEAVLE